MVGTLYTIINEPAASKNAARQSAALAPEAVRKNAANPFVDRLTPFTSSAFFL